MKNLRNILLFCFFLSGAAGLVYEVVWTRMLTLVFGTTVHATGTVLTAFMAGLALGSFTFGRFIDRREDALRIYGILEAAIGLYCLFTPFIIVGLAKTYVPFYYASHSYPLIFLLFRFGLCFIILLIPTTLMGATLPVLSKFFVRNLGVLGWDVGRLYSVNTFGAVLGCFGTGFILIQTVGVVSAVYVAAAINLAVGGLVLFLGSGIKFAAARVHYDGGGAESVQVLGSNRIYASWVLVLVLAFFALSGFMSMAYEVAWTRALGLVFGSSVYAFTTMLTAFLCGLALGAFIFAIFLDRVKEPLFLFGLVELGVGLAVITLTPVFGRLPFLFMQVYAGYHANFFIFQSFQFLICFGLMLIPTTLLGGIFPIVSKIYTESLQHLGRRIGDVYSVNTLGCIFGSFVASFLLIPLMGVENTILAAALVNVLIGFFIVYSIYALREEWKDFFWVTLALLLALGYWGMVNWWFSWDKHVMNTGLYYHPEHWVDWMKGKDLEAALHANQLLYYGEGVTANVAVFEAEGQLFLHINGKVEASSQYDLPTQLFCGHLPLLWHRHPQKVLLIGLGSGCTLGAVEQHPVKSIDCIEIEPKVVKAAGYFKDVNNNALEDTRVKTSLEDGRNFVLLTKNIYDVIISEPSNPYISGVSNLFTLEHYLQCKAKLAPDGIMCQWFHYYSMSLRDFKIAIKTFAEAFRYVSLWDLRNGDVLMLGSAKPLAKDLNILAAKLGNPKIRGDLERVGLADWYSILDKYVMGESGINRFVGDVPINIDNHPIIEFSAPRYLYASTFDEISKALHQFKSQKTN